MKNLSLSISTPETAEACLQLDGTQPMICLDTPASPGAVWVFADQATADRIIACVNTCNDLETIDLASIEVRQVIANIVEKNQQLLGLLGLLVRNAYKIEHASFHLQGHEEFDPETVLNTAKALITEANAAAHAALVAAQPSEESAVEAEA